MEYRDGMTYTQWVHAGFLPGEPDASDPEVLAWLIRRHGLEMTHISRGSHIGAIFSVAEIMAVLYTRILNVNPADPAMENRDRLILSKGHAGAAVYAALAERGFFPVEELRQHYANGSHLSGHVSHRGVPTFVVLGDGECDEGSVWEAALEANHFGLDHLIAVVDHNHMQSLDFCENTIRLEPFDDKWAAFGWYVQRVDGHDVHVLEEAFRKALEHKGSPSVIIADTVKGKGVSFMENDILWHYRTPQGEEYEAARLELEAQRP